MEMKNKVADIPTPREYKALREAQLDREFHERYPEGKFTLHRRGLPQNWGGDRQEMYWHPHRRCGCRNWGEPLPPCLACIPRTFVGITSNEDGIGELTYQNNSFGKCTHYKTLDKMLAGAKRFNYPAEVIKRFTELYKLKAGI